MPETAFPFLLLLFTSSSPFASPDESLVCFNTNFNPFFDATRARILVLFGALGRSAPGGGRGELFLPIFLHPFSGPLVEGSPSLVVFALSDRGERVRPLQGAYVGGCNTSAHPG